MTTPAEVKALQRHIEELSAQVVRLNLSVADKCRIIRRQQQTIALVRERLDQQLSTSFVWGPVGVLAIFDAAVKELSFE